MWSECLKIQWLVRYSLNDDPFPTHLFGVHKRLSGYRNGR